MEASSPSSCPQNSRPRYESWTTTSATRASTETSSSSFPTYEAFFSSFNVHGSLPASQPDIPQSHLLPSDYDSFFASLGSHPHIPHRQPPHPTTVVSNPSAIPQLEHRLLSADALPRSLALIMNPSRSPTDSRVPTHRGLSPHSPMVVDSDPRRSPMQFGIQRPPSVTAMVLSRSPVNFVHRPSSAVSDVSMASTRMHFMHPLPRNQVPISSVISSRVTTNSHHPPTLCSVHEGNAAHSMDPPHSSLPGSEDENLSPRKAKVHTHRLDHSEEQKAAVQKIYDAKQHTSLDYEEDDCTKALDTLVLLGIDRGSRDDLERRWSIAWSSTPWETKNGSKKRILFRCLCGYNTQARQERDRKYEAQQLPPDEDLSTYTAATRKEWERRQPYPFTGCLAHVEITEREDGFVSRIVGILDHNEDCKKAKMERLPSIPVHPHVYEVALEQLKNGSPITAIQRLNTRMYEQEAYRGQKEDKTTQNWRYVLEVRDHCTLYRKLASLYGINIRRAPQYNLDNWVNGPTDPARHLPSNVQRLVREAIFHYEPIVKRGDLLKVCISTPEMDEAAYKYVHKKQLILDGTFGVASSRILLFIAMGVDEQGKGVPVALFLFSAPPDAKATHANYDTGILTEMLFTWLRHMFRKFAVFQPAIAITDNDARERAALLAVWPNIILLLCKYHARERWLNSRKQKIKGPESSTWKVDVNDRLNKMELRLFDTIDYDVALGYLLSERQYLEKVKDSGLGGQAVIGGIKHIDYFIANWMPIALWKSWSLYGRTAASNVLGISVDSVLTTTNHLERFNCILKRKEIAGWLHSGKRLRFDTLIFVLITEILPNIYRKLRARRDYADWCRERFRKAAGGDVVEMDRTRKAEKKAAKEAESRVCWWKSDELCDGGALEVLRAQSFGDTVNISDDRQIFRGTCQSSSGRGVYTVEIQHDGQALCTCPDFQSRGGACKHLRAFRIIVDNWLLMYHQPPFAYPTSVGEALAIQKLRPEAIPPESQPDDIPGPDFIGLQHLANDTTTLGDDFDAEEGNDWESDDEGADDDHDREIVGISNEEQWEAINFQNKTILESELASILPKLARIGQTLQDIHTLPSSDNMARFATLIESVGHRIATLNLSSRPASPNSSQSSPTGPLSTTASSQSSPLAQARTNSLPTTPHRSVQNRQMRRTVSQPTVFQDVEATPVPPRRPGLTISDLTSGTVASTSSSSSTSELLPPFQPSSTLAATNSSADKPIRAGPFGRTYQPEKRLRQPSAEQKQTRKQAKSCLPG